MIFKSLNNSGYVKNKEIYINYDIKTIYFNSNMYKFTKVPPYYTLYDVYFINSFYTL